MSNYIKNIVSDLELIGRDVYVIDITYDKVCIFTAKISSITFCKDTEFYYTLSNGNRVDKCNVCLDMDSLQTRLIDILCKKSYKIKEE